MLSAWEGFRLKIDECRELDNSRVLVLFRILGRGRRSGAEIESRSNTHVWTLRAGKVTRLVNYWDRDRALADLGLEG